MKVLLVTNIPTPYRIPLFNRMHAILRGTGDGLHVLFQMSGYGRRRWENPLAEADFPYDVLELPALRSGFENAYPVPLRIGKAVRGLEPSMIVAAGFNIVSAVLARQARRMRIPFLVWSGETLSTARAAAWRRLRRYLRGYIAARCAGFIAYGSSAVEYLESIGVAPTKIGVAQNTVDTEYFRDAVASLRKERGERPPGEPVRLLYVGQLQERKGLEHLLRAMKRLDGENLFLDVAGDGPERSRYERLAKELGLPNVRFHGFKQKRELPRYYAGADIFIFPSIRELYGLVLVEAAAAGLPVIASGTAGAAMDAVRDGETGFILDVRNEGMFAEKMRLLSREGELRRRFGKSAAMLAAEKFSLGGSAERFVCHLRACARGDAMAAPPPRPAASVSSGA